MTEKAVIRHKDTLEERFGSQLTIIHDRSQLGMSSVIHWRARGGDEDDVRRDCVRPADILRAVRERMEGGSIITSPERRAIEHIVAAMSLLGDEEAREEFVDGVADHHSEAAEAIARAYNGKRVAPLSQVPRAVAANSDIDAIHEHINHANAQQEKRIEDLCRRIDEMGRRSDRGVSQSVFDELKATVTRIDKAAKEDAARFERATSNMTERAATALSKANSAEKALEATQAQIAGLVRSADISAMAKRINECEGQVSAHRMRIADLAASVPSSLTVCVSWLGALLAFIATMLWIHQAAR